MRRPAGRHTVRHVARRFRCWSHVWRSTSSSSGADRGSGTAGRTATRGPRRQHDPAAATSTPARRSPSIRARLAAHSWTRTRIPGSRSATLVQGWTARDLSRTPLVSVIFNMDKVAAPIDFGELTVDGIRDTEGVLQSTWASTRSTTANASWSSATSTPTCSTARRWRGGSSGTGCFRKAGHRGTGRRTRRADRWCRRVTGVVGG